MMSENSVKSQSIYKHLTVECANKTHSHHCTLNQLAKAADSASKMTVTEASDVLFHSQPFEKQRISDDRLEGVEDSEKSA